MLTFLLVGILSQRANPFGGDTNWDALPWTAGQLEIVLGVKPRPDTAYGLYTFRESMYFQYGNSVTAQGAQTAVKKGFVSWRIHSENLSGKALLLFETEGTRNLVRFEDGKIVGGPVAQDALFANTLTIGAGRKVWFDQNGHIQRETYTTVNHTGTYFLGADFKANGDIDIMMKNGNGEKHTTLTPAEGAAAFDSEFQPMLDGAKVLLKEKKFLTFDPVTGGLVRWKAEVRTRFHGVLNDEKCQGTLVEVRHDKAIEEILVDDDGILVQVNLPDKAAIVLDSRSNKELPGINRVHLGG